MIRIRFNGLLIIIVMVLAYWCWGCTLRLEMVSATPDPELQAWRAATDDWLRKGSAALTEHEQRLGAIENQLNKPVVHLTHDEKEQ